MKFLVVLAFLATSAFASKIEEPELLGPAENLRALIENLRKQMPCGFPEEGIPSLAPFKHPYVSAEIGNILFSLVASAYNIQVDGLNGFEIHDINLSILSMKVTYDFQWKEVKASGKYVLEKFFFTLWKLTGAGDIDLTIRDFRIRGDLELGVLDEHMILKSFNIVIALGDFSSKMTGLLGGGPILNHVANRAIEEFITFMIREQSKLVSKLVAKEVVPMANEMLSQYTLTDIIGMATKPVVPSTCGDEEQKAFSPFLERLLSQKL